MKFTWKTAIYDEHVIAAITEVDKENLLSRPFGGYSPKTRETLVSLSVMPKEVMRAAAGRGACAWKNFWGKYRAKGETSSVREYIFRAILIIRSRAYRGCASSTSLRGCTENRAGFIGEFRWSSGAPYKRYRDPLSNTANPVTSLH